MIITKKTIRSIWIVFCLFIVIFNPPIVSFNLLHVVAFASWLWILTNRSEVKRRIYIGRVQHISFVLLGVMIYLGFNAAFNDNSIIAAVIDCFYFIFEIIPFCVYCVCNIEGDRMKIINWLRIVALIQAILAVMAFMMPSVKTYFNQKLINYGYGDVILDMMGYRQNGFASSLTSYSSYFQAFIAVICFYLFMNGKEKRMYNLALFALISFSAIINARTSIVILMLGILLILFGVSGNTARSGLLRLLIIIVGIIMLPFALRLIASSDNSTSMWISDGISDIKNILHGDVGGSNSFFYYYKDFWHIPDGLDILFGKGTVIMGSVGRLKYGISSDVGFVNDIWKGGIIYTLFLWFGFLWTLRLMKNYMNAIGDHLFCFILSFFFIVAILINLKGFFFVKEAHTIVYMLLFLSLLCDKRISYEGESTL